MLQVCNVLRDGGYTTFDIPWPTSGWASEHYLDDPDHMCHEVLHSLLALRIVIVRILFVAGPGSVVANPGGVPRGRRWGGAQRCSLWTPRSRRTIIRD